MRRALIEGLNFGFRSSWADWDIVRQSLSPKKSVRTRRPNARARNLHHRRQKDTAYVALPVVRADKCLLGGSIRKSCTSPDGPVFPRPLHLAEDLI